MSNQKVFEFRARSRQIKLTMGKCSLILCIYFVSIALIVKSLKSVRKLSSMTAFPICSNNDISHGHWLNVTTEILQNPTHLSALSRHFYNGGPGEALNFSQIWLPHNCKYHRFTNHSLNAIIDHIIQEGKSNASLNIPLLPDGRLHLALIGGWVIFN